MSNISNVSRYARALVLVSARRQKISAGRVYGFYEKQDLVGLILGSVSFVW